MFAVIRPVQGEKKAQRRQRETKKTAAASPFTAEARDSGKPAEEPLTDSRMARRARSFDRGVCDGGIFISGHPL